MTVSHACERWLALLTGWEGKGKSKRPADLGGETWYGITVKNHPEILRVPPSERAAAARVIAVNYWHAVRADEVAVLSPPLAIALVDWTFNSDRGMVVRKLQSIVGVGRDGRLGGLTLAAIARWIEAHPPTELEPASGAVQLARVLHRERVRYLHDLIKRVPSQNENRGGWWMRTTELAFELA